MNPWAIVFALVTWGLSLAGAGWWFYGAGQDAQKAKQADIEAVRQQTRDDAAQGVADAIFIANENGTKVVTRIRTLTSEVPVYRAADCKHDPRVFDELNRALRGEPSGEGSVSAGPGSAGGPTIRHDDGQTR